MTSAQTSTMGNQAAPNARKIAIGLSLLLLFVLVLVYRLGQFPYTDHDESSYLHVAENFAKNSVYADFSSEGNRYTGPVVSTGPTVILPIALMYRAFGVGIPTARLVMVAYALLMLVSLHGFVKTYGGQRLGFLTLALAVFNYDVLVGARRVSGEIPALAFTIAALWLWLRDGKRSPAALAAVGVLFGLACITKNQLALFICPGLLLAWILELVWYRQRGSLHFIIPGVITGIMYLAWTVYILYWHGAGVRDVSADLEALREFGSLGFLESDPSIMESNALYLVSSQSGFVLLMVPFGLALSLKRDRDGQRWGILNLFILLNLGLFITSVGWQRFALPSVVLTTPVLAWLIYDSTNGLRIDLTKLSEWKRQPPDAADAATLVGVALLLGTIAFGVPRELHDIARISDYAPYHVADFMNENIPEEALIESWELELAVLTDHTIHYPPQRAEVYASHPSIESNYDFHDYVDPDYVIVGTYGRRKAVYEQENLTDYTLIHSIEQYDIYQRTDDTTG